MIPAILPSASKIYSTLGNNNSLVPLAMKDIANSMGLTAGSYIVGDKTEGKDRFIDEFGTQAIWLFGIPVYKKVLDWTMFKSLGYDSKIDPRILKNQKIFEKAKQFAPSQEILANLEKVGKNQKFFKGLNIAKFAASTLLTIFTYGALTKYRHKATEDALKKEILAKAAAKKSQKNKEVKEQNSSSTSLLSSPAFATIHEKNVANQKTPSFTGGLEDFMFSPVKNLMIVDASITTERLTQSRNKQDFMGYVVKEGSFWAFMYFAGQKIQDYLEKKAETKYNRSIDLDARVIESQELKDAFKNNTLSNSLKAFGDNKTDDEIYEFILKNEDNFVVQMAKKSDIITTFKDGDLKGKVDTRAFIDIDAVKGIKSKLEKLQNQFNNSKLHNNHTKDEALDIFLGQVKKLKRCSVLKNIGACIGALGIVAPALMVALRYLDKDNKDFQVKKDLEKKLAFEGTV